MFEKEHSDITKSGFNFLGVYDLGGTGMANLHKAFRNQFHADFQGRNNPVILSKSTLGTLNGLIGAGVDQIHSKPPLSFGNEEQEVLRTCLQEGPFPVHNSSPKQYQVVALMGPEALLYADHKDNNLSGFSQVSQNVYVPPLLQGSR